MNMTADQLPDDISALKKLVLNYQHDAVKYQQQVDALQEQLRLLLHKRFGRSTEQAPPNQLGLFDESETLLAEEIEASDCEDELPASSMKEPENKTKRGARKPLPAYLPRIEVIHDLTESEKICPHDGYELQRIGEESSEQLDIIPAKIQVIKNIRYKYACPCCDQAIRQAKLPAQPLPKSQASAGLLSKSRPNIKIVQIFIRFNPLPKNLSQYFSSPSFS